jgi:catecholate siderophore receptor
MRALNAELDLLFGLAEGQHRAPQSKNCVSFGVISAVIAGGIGSAAQAQEATPLPPLEVTAKPAQKKKSAPARAPAPVVSAPAAPVPEPEPVVPVAATSGFGDGTSLTPASGNTLQSGTGLGRLPGTIQDTPQTINVIPQQQIIEQNITTLDQALQNVPGVTVNIGEGGGGMNGDQFRIRGFQAKGDIYIDGLRDFGVYVRDSFAYEQVEVIKGPSSETFGMGTTGGAINIQQKIAHLGNDMSIEGITGSGPYYRSVVDVNRQLNGTTAIRAVGMFHNQDIVDRDHIYTDRWGFLGSLAMGIDTDTTWVLNYLHQTGERKPDFGVPLFDPDAIDTPSGVIRDGPALARPVTEFGIRRSNFYGKVTDIDDSDVDMITSQFSSNFNPWLTLYNDTRLAWYDRDFKQTVPNCPAATEDTTDYTCGDSILNRMFDGPYGLGGPAGFAQESWGVQNVTTAAAEFNTGGLKHELIAGIDVFYQDEARTQMGVYNAAGVLQPGTGEVVKDPTTIGWPNYRKTIPYTVREDPLYLKQAEAQDFALFASDQIWLTETLSVLGGIRWDDYRAKYRATDPATGLWTGPGAISTNTDSQFTSPKASVIWEPAQNQTYYVSWSRSYTPQGQFVTNENNAVTTTAGESEADPEENELWEVGAKLSTVDGRLGFTAALFQVTKGNASFIDPFTGDTQLTGEEQRVRGIELGLTGSLSEAWQVQLGYAYLDSEILFNPASVGRTVAAQNEYRGNEVPFASPNNFSVWTTYELSAHVPAMRGVFTIGGGVIYNDAYFTNSANTRVIPSNFSLDALISYEQNGWRFAVNGYNLTDELNYSAGFASRALPAPGSTVLATVGKRF